MKNHLNGMESSLQKLLGTLDACAQYLPKYGEGPARDLWLRDIATVCEVWESRRSSVQLEFVHV